MRRTWLPASFERDSDARAKDVEQLEVDVGNLFHALEHE